MYRTVKKMNMKNNIARIGAVLLGLSMVACLDDNKYALDPSGTQNVIEFLDVNVPNSPSGAIYPAWDEAFAYEETVHLERTISFSGPNSNSRDIEVVIEKDPTALEDFNAQMIETGHPELVYELMPDNYYDLDATTLTIEKGSTKATLGITLFPPEFDLSKRFALPLRIVSSSFGILSAHYSVGIFGLAIKNKYDADYTVSITTTGWAAYGIADNTPGTYPGKIGLVTTGPNTNTFANYYGGSDLQPAFTTANAGATQFGAAGPVFTFEEVGTAADPDKLVNVDNKYPNDGRGRDFYVTDPAPAGRNLFYEVEAGGNTARSLIADYNMIQNGRPVQRIVMQMTFFRER